MSNKNWNEFADNIIDNDKNLSVISMLIILETNERSSINVLKF